MSIINKVFIDSSALIEYFKGSKLDLLDNLADMPDCSLVINEAVVSEVVYHIIGYMADVSPVTLKRKERIAQILTEIRLESFFRNFEIVNNPTDIQKLLILMQTGNYLPNDALILNCCIQNNIRFLATYDADFRHSFISLRNPSALLSTGLRKN